MNNPLLENSQKVKLTKFIGKRVTCEDGEKRTVLSVLPTADFRYFQINATPTHEGFRAHLLFAMNEIEGKPKPSEELRKTFDEIALSFSLEWKDKDRGFEWPRKSKPKPKGKILVFK